MNDFIKQYEPVSKGKTITIPLALYAELLYSKINDLNEWGNWEETKQFEIELKRVKEELGPESLDKWTNC